MTFQILWNVVSVCYLFIDLFIYLFVRLRLCEMGVNGKGGSIEEIHFISEYPKGQEKWKENMEGTHCTENVGCTFYNMHVPHVFEPRIMLLT